MGVAAYYRGSAAISEQIARDYQDRNRSKDLRQQMQRAADKITQLEDYSRLAQSLYIDVVDKTTAIGFLKTHMHLTYVKKKNTKVLKRMLERCNAAHCAWVDSDHVEIFNHLAICKEKALSWQAVLEYLNKSGVMSMPFKPVN